MIRRLSALFAALLIGSAAGVAVAAAPAAAAACPRGSGVTVVVGSSVSCDGNGGGRASSNFADAGHSLRYVQRQPGFVCQVDGAPSSATCVNTPPADAYWGLFWSDGTSGSWTYANKGVGTLSIPAGGWVAFVYQSNETMTYPGVKPVGAAPAPKPTTKPTPKPKPAPTTAAPAQPSPRPTSTATPSTKVEKGEPRRKAEAERKKPEVSATPSASTSTDSMLTEEQSERVDEASAETPGDGRLIWVAGTICLALLAGMGGMLWRRRSSGGLGS